MRIELWILLIAAVCVANIYTDGKYLKLLYKWKKLYQIIGIILGALFLYYVIKKNPMKTGEILQASNDYLKYLPMDKNSIGFISPILDFTSRQNLYKNESMGYPVARMPTTDLRSPGKYGQRAESLLTNNFVGDIRSPGKFVQVQQSNNGLEGGTRLMNSGKKGSKRSVSETKKKFVASRQNWQCGHCNKQLSAWFEVDHKIRLEYGGDNHIDNLVALCRECHGEKTAMENL
uniref:HNH nuclease domain-containing protein n=1 Tax=viral metagenome TaxID=1070528 RepID=A0A6C0IC94_9ZZZZ